MADPIDIEGLRDYVRIGSGGFSTVYRAYQERFDRLVAVKLLTATIVDDQGRKRFLRECAIAGRVSFHPNIVSVYDAGFTADGQPYIVFEFMPGGSLATEVARRGSFPLAEALSIGVKLSSALAVVHAEGVTHRDIKPLNVLISRMGEPCLTDFGISAISTGLGQTSQTNSLTPLFTAPEVIDGELSTPASDVYSLGATLYALLAGRSPFQPTGNEGIRVTLHRIFESPVPPIDREDVPPGVEELLARSMAKSPVDRLGNADEFRSALQRFLSGVDIASVPTLAAASLPSEAVPDSSESTTVRRPPVAPVAPRPEPDATIRRPQPKRKQAVLVIAAAIVLVGAAIGGILSAMSGGKPHSSHALSDSASSSSLASSRRTSPPTSAVTSSPGWSAPVRIDSYASTSNPNTSDPGTDYLASISCTADDFCVTVDTAGNAMIYNGHKWGAPQKLSGLLPSHDEVVDVSCGRLGGLPPDPTVPLIKNEFCVAVDSRNKAWTYGAGAWTGPQIIDPYGAYNAADTHHDGLISVSCPAAYICMAVDTAGYAIKLRGLTWQDPVRIDPGAVGFPPRGSTAPSLLDVSCSFPFCMAVDTAGNAMSEADMGTDKWSSPSAVGLTSSAPATGSTGSAIDAVSCELGPSTPVNCAGIDSAGDARTYSTSSGWSQPTTIDPAAHSYSSSSGTYLSDVSCTSRLCVAVDSAGNAIQFNGSSLIVPAKAIDPETAASKGNIQVWSVSCGTATFCAAIDTAGNAIMYQPHS